MDIATETTAVTTDQIRVVARQAFLFNKVVKGYDEVEKHLTEQVIEAHRVPASPSAQLAPSWVTETDLWQLAEADGLIFKIN